MKSKNGRFGKLYLWQNGKSTQDSNNNNMK